MYPHKSKSYIWGNKAVIITALINSPLERGGPCMSPLGLQYHEQFVYPFKAPMLAGRGVEMLPEGMIPFTTTATFNWAPYGRKPKINHKPVIPETPTQKQVAAQKHSQRYPGSANFSLRPCQTPAPQRCTGLCGTGIPSEKKIAAGLGLVDPG
ncbi:hypothetical protein CYPRO_2378 [Cyclonatronum proteinivorum]|uniref:Uncharacterized protein n=1 Tax=Cyclonatronum proteinivorum TaxID=1457365 RepID=A0A345UMB8_9BACT|nr:hypothetical protein CYPRO_2378 [Cyclonatronum proteinivorum]